MQIRCLKNNKKTMLLLKYTTQIFFGALILVMAGCIQQPIQVAPVERQTYKLIFDDKTVGRFVSEQYHVKGVIKTTQTLTIKSQFKGLDSSMTHIIETHEESLDGKALRFSMIYDAPLAKKEVFAEAKNNNWIWRAVRGGQVQAGVANLPEGFLLHSGLKTAMKKVIPSSKSFNYQNWNSTAKRFENVQLNIKAFDEKKHAWLIEQTYPEAINRRSSDFWVDDEYNLLEINMRYLGKDIEVIPCDAQCDAEAVEALRPLDYQMLASPYRITESALNGQIRYQIQAHSTLTPPATTEQQVSKKDNYWMLNICTRCGDGAEVDPAENLNEYLQSNEWMAINDKNLIQAVNRAINPKDTADKKMKALVKATRARLRTNLQFSGYATASQAFESRSGDCTEYALLLAAMSRIAKIPTRIVFGLSYSREYFHGRRHMFAPHAWVQAWVNGQWKSYDAGLNKFDSGHIALQISDGNPEDFSVIFKNFTDLKIISAQQIIKKNGNH